MTLTMFLVLTAILVLVLMVLGVGTPPTPTTRGTPTGFRTPDGYQALITLSNAPAINLWEKTPKPPAVDGGEPIDITTMHNVKWHQMHPRTLIKMDPGTCTCAYDPKSLSTIYAQINVPQTITYHYRDGTSECFYGWLQKFERAELKEGEFPEGTATFIPSMSDAAGYEEGPVITPGSGT